LSPEEQRRLVEPGTTNAAAHEAYLRGVHHMSLRTPAEVSKGLGWLQKAVSLDPRYGAAQATLGETYLFFALEGGGAPSPLMEKTRELAVAALAVDPDLAEGHRALGLVHAFRDRDWPAAEEQLRAAVALGPGMFPNHEALAAALLLPHGRIREAVAEQREACAANPLSASAVAMLGRLTELAGQEAEGVRLLESAIDLEPRYARAYVQLAKVHLRHGRPADAVGLLRRAAELAPEGTSWFGALAVTYQRLGRRADAEALARQLDERSAAGRAPAFARAEVAMALGHIDAAFRWFERAADEREPWVVYLAVDPIYEPLHADPRFGALVRRLGLPTPAS
jgi:serine/threonine-protein kinase